MVSVDLSTCDCDSQAVVTLRGADMAAAVSAPAAGWVAWPFPAAWNVAGPVAVAGRPAGCADDR